jgi:hypothetical protein
VKFKIQNSKPNFRKLAIFLCLAIFVWIYSCASLRDWKVGRDNFSRTYAEDFMTSHPKLNSALQDYAKRHEGNSFQVTHLGSDKVIIQGLHRGDQGRLFITITLKPAGPGRSRVEIKVPASDPKIPSEYLEHVVNGLFQTIENGTGVRPLE